MGFGSRAFLSHSAQMISDLFALSWIALLHLEHRFRAMFKIKIIHKAADGKTFPSSIPPGLVLGVHGETVRVEGATP